MMKTCTWYESDDEVKICVCPYCNTVVSAKEHYYIIEEKRISTANGINKPE